MSGIISDNDAYKMFARAVERAGSQSGYAAMIGVSPQYVHDMLKKRRPLGEKVLEALGIERARGYDFKERRP